MAGKDDFFGDGSGIGEGEEPSLDDFFQPAVTKPDQPPQAPQPPQPEPPEAAPPPPPSPPEPPPPATPQPPPTSSTPEVQPFPEVEEPLPEPMSPPAQARPESGETLFPMEKGAEMPVETADEPDLAKETSSKKARAASGESVIGKIPRLAIFVVIGIVLAVLLGGGGYFGYEYLANKKKKSAEKKPVAASVPSPVVTVEKPAVEGEGGATAQPAPPPVTSPKPQKPATQKPVGKVKPYKPKPLPALPPVKRLSPGEWSVHLERLALKSTLAKDAIIVKKAGLQPFRAPESRASGVTEYRVMADFTKVSDAHAAAWKADELGYRPEVKVRGRRATVTFVVSFSRGFAEQARKKLAGKGIKNLRVKKVRNYIKLQSLRVGPFKTEAEARQAAMKLKSKGFPNATVMRK